MCARGLDCAGPWQSLSWATEHRNSSDGTRLECDGAFGDGPGLRVPRAGTAQGPHGKPRFRGNSGTARPRHKPPSQPLSAQRRASRAKFQSRRSGLAGVHGSRRRIRRQHKLFHTEPPNPHIQTACVASGARNVCRLPARRPPASAGRVQEIVCIRHADKASKTVSVDGCLPVRTLLSPVCKEPTRPISGKCYLKLPRQGSAAPGGRLHIPIVAKRYVFSRSAGTAS